MVDERDISILKEKWNLSKRGNHSRVINILLKILISKASNTRKLIIYLDIYIRQGSNIFTKY